MESKSMALVLAITANCPYHTPSTRPWGILWEERGVGGGSCDNLYMPNNHLHITH